MRHILSLGPFALLVPILAAAPTVPASHLAERLDEYLSRLTDVGFSGVVLVARDGEVVLERGYGMAIRERKVPMTPDTILPVGSITKQFTAAGILKLEMEGKLRVDDPLEKFLGSVPADKRRITLHHLLTHAAGFESDYGSSDAEPVSRDEAMRRVMTAPLRSMPGEEYHYSNAGYSVLAAVIEIVSGKSWEEYLRERLFHPAGMSLTGCVLPEWNPNTVAHGYVGERDTGTMADEFGPDGPYWNLLGNGGVLSTVGDMYKWHLALLGDSVLSSEARTKAFTPHIREGKDADSFYGYGWALFKSPRNTSLIAHNGGNGIFAADFLRFVDENVAIYLATNTAEMLAWEVSPTLDRIAFGGKYELPPKVATVPQERLEALTGPYEVGNGDTVVVSARPGHVVLTPRGAKSLALLFGTSRIESARFDRLSSKAERTATAAWLQADMAERWQQLEVERGLFKATEVLGTVAGREGRALTFAELQFARGSQIAVFVFDEDDSLLGLRLRDSLPERRLYPTSADNFVSFELNPASPAVGFRVEDDHGRVAGLSISSAAGRVSIPRS